MDVHQELFFIRNLLLMLVLVVGIFLMNTLAGIMLPLVMALLLSILYLPIVLYLEKKKIPHRIHCYFYCCIYGGRYPGCC